jgi:hypothetical protein
MEEHRNLLHEATVVSKCDVKFLQWEQLVFSFNVNSEQA